MAVEQETIIDKAAKIRAAIIKELAVKNGERNEARITQLAEERGLLLSLLVDIREASAVCLTNDFLLIGEGRDCPTVPGRVCSARCQAYYYLGGVDLQGMGIKTPHDLINHYYMQGMTDAKIAETLGYHRMTIYRWRVDHNMPPNSKAGSKRKKQGA